MERFEHKGFNIEVLSSGQFQARVGDVTITKPTLEEVKAQIDKESLATKRAVSLKVIGVLRKDRWRGPSGVFDDEDRVVSARVIGIHRTSRELQFESIPKGYTLSYVMADTSDNRATLASLMQFERALASVKKEYLARHVVAEGYGRIEIGEYERELAKLEALYKKSAEKIIQTA